MLLFTIDLATFEQVRFGQFMILSCFLSHKFEFKMQLLRIIAVMLVALVACNAVELTPASTGSVEVQNESTFVCKFILEYKQNGQTQNTSSGEILKGKSETMPIPNGASNIKVELYGKEGSAKFELLFTWSFDAPVIKCYKIKGSILKPSYETC